MMQAALAVSAIVGAKSTGGTVNEDPIEEPGVKGAANPNAKEGDADDASSEPQPE